MVGGCLKVAIKMSEFGQAESWLRRADHKLEEAEVQLKQKYNYSESVSEIKEEEFKNLLDKIHQDLKNIYNYI